MSEREIVRKDGKPFAFKTQTVQFIRIGKKTDPQQYTPSCRIRKNKCR